MTIRQCLIIGALAAAFGASAHSANAQASKDVSAKLDRGQPVERWLFVGRRSERGWHPPSVSISPPAYPLKPGNTVVVKRHALAYGSVDCKVLDAADVKAYEDVSSSVELVKAGGEALEITGAPIECPSVCGAKTVWVYVRIPAARLLQIDH